jgi:hypothetical protein
VDRRLLEYAEQRGGPFPLSDFLAWFEALGATEAQLHLSCLFVSTIFMHASKRWSIDLIPENVFTSGRLFGSNFQILLLDRNEENYTRENDRSE